MCAEPTRWFVAGRDELAARSARRSAAAHLARGGRRSRGVTEQSTSAGARVPRRAPGDWSCESRDQNVMTGAVAAAEVSLARSLPRLGASDGFSRRVGL